MTALIDRSHCSALVITCSDFRFKATERAFAETAGLDDDYDLLARPGAARSLVQPRSPAANATMIDEMRLLHSLHQFSRVLLLNHTSCRAYDDLAGPENERAVHTDHLRRAVGVVQAMLPGVNPEPYYLDYVEGAFAVTKVGVAAS
jgi:hypothetical protein